MNQTALKENEASPKRKGWIRTACVSGLVCLLLAYASLALWSYSTTKDADERWARLVELAGPVRNRNSSPRPVHPSEAEILASSELYSEWRARWPGGAQQLGATERARRLLEALEQDVYFFPDEQISIRESVEQAFEVALGFGDLSPREFELLHDFARTWQTRGDTQAFWQRMQRLEMLLDRAEGDEAFRAALRSKPAPRASEAFDALCREAVLQQTTTAHILDHGVSSPPRPAEFTRELHELLLLTLLERSLDLEDRKDEPGSWRGPKRRHESGIWSWRIVTGLNLKRLHVRAVSPGVEWGIYPPELGPEWVEILDRWEKAVGP